MTSSSANVEAAVTRSASKRRHSNAASTFFCTKEQPASQRQKCCDTLACRSMTRSTTCADGECQVYSLRPRRCTTTKMTFLANKSALSQHHTHAKPPDMCKALTVEAVTIRFVDADLQLEKSVSIIACSAGNLPLRHMINTYCYSSLWQLPMHCLVSLRITCKLHPASVITMRAGEDVCFTQHIFHTHSTCENLTISILVPWKADKNALIKHAAQQMKNVPIPLPSEMELTNPSSVFMLLHRLEYLDCATFSSVLLQLVSEPCCLELIRKVHLYSRLFTDESEMMNLQGLHESFSDVLVKRHALQIWKTLAKDSSLHAYDRCDMINFLLLIVSGKLDTEQRNCFESMEPYFDAVGFKNGVFVPNTTGNDSRSYNVLLCSIYGLLLSILSKASFWRTLRISDVSILQNTANVIHQLSCFLHKHHFTSSDTHNERCHQHGTDTTNILSPMWIFWMRATLSVPIRQEVANAAVFPDHVALHRHFSMYQQWSSRTLKNSNGATDYMTTHSALLRDVGNSYFQMCDVFGNRFPKVIAEFKHSMCTDTSLRWEWNEYASDKWCSQIAGIENEDARRNVREQVSRATHVALADLQCSVPHKDPLNHYFSSLLHTLCPPTSEQGSSCNAYSDMVATVTSMRVAQRCEHHSNNGNFMRGDTQVRTLVYAAQNCAATHHDILNSTAYSNMIALHKNDHEMTLKRRCFKKYKCADGGDARNSSRTQNKTVIWLRKCENSLLDALQVCMQACQQAFHHYMMNSATYSTSFMHAPMHLAYIMFDMYTLLKSSTIFQFHPKRREHLLNFMNTHVLADANLVTLWNRFTHLNERTCMADMHVGAAILMQAMNFQLHFLTKHKLFRMERCMHRRMQCRNTEHSRVFTIRRVDILADSLEMLSSLQTEAKERVACTCTDSPIGILSVLPAFHIFFKDEIGRGHGVRLDWFTCVCHKLFTDRNDLWSSSVTDKRVLVPRICSRFTNAMENEYKLAGFLIGFGIYWDIPLISIVAPYILKILCSKDSKDLSNAFEHEDVNDDVAMKHKTMELQENFKHYDVVVYNSHQQMCLMSDVDISKMSLHFEVSYKCFNITSKTIESVTYPLVPRGETILVQNQADVKRFRHLYVQSRLIRLIHLQLRALREGYHIFGAVSKSFTVFNHSEILEVCLPPVDLDINTWRAMVIVQWKSVQQDNPSQNQHISVSNFAQWFWSIVSQFSSANRTKLLRFWTGVEYFPNLLNHPHTNLQLVIVPTSHVGSSNHAAYGYPWSHTCFRQLCVPAYPTQAMLRCKLIELLQFDKEMETFQLE
jgi:hypothetical protein